LLEKAPFEIAVLSILVYSVEHSPQLTLKVTPELFTNKTNKKIAKTALSYISLYHTPPGKQIDLLLEADLGRGTEGDLFRIALKEIEERSQYLDPIFILAELDTFIEEKKFETMLSEAYQVYEAGDLGAAREVLAKQISIPQQGTEGILLQDPKQSLKFLDAHESDEYFSSGIEILDKKGARPERKTLSFLIAAAKKGKSWWLTAVGKGGLQYHHSVLHLTLELSEEKTARRYIQSIFSLTKEQTELVRVPYFVKDSAGSVCFSFEEFQRDAVLTKRKELHTRLQAMSSYPPLIIKEFPTSAFSTEQLSLYLDSLKREKGFTPDLLVIDYADLMKLDAQALRIDTGRLYRELRGIAVSRNIAMVTATQGNRESEFVKVVAATNVAEDWSKIGTADTVLTYSQTLQERALGLARIFVSNARDTEDKYLVLISQSYIIGQFCLSSTLMTAELANQLESQAG
jgi:replicative DNA helicase